MDFKEYFFKELQSHKCGFKKITNDQMKDVQSHVRGCFKVFFQGLWKPEMWTFKEYFFKELQSQKRGFSL